MGILDMFRSKEQIIEMREYKGLRKLSAFCADKSNSWLDIGEFRNRILAILDQLFWEVDKEFGELGIKPGGRGSFVYAPKVLKLGRNEIVSFPQLLGANISRKSLMVNEFRNVVKRTNDVKTLIDFSQRMTDQVLVPFVNEYFKIIHVVDSTAEFTNPREFNVRVLEPLRKNAESHSAELKALGIRDIPPVRINFSYEYRV